MRAVRGLAMAAVVVAALIPATWADADGGAYVELQRTHYLPGQTAVGETYISVPRSDQDQLDRGPFYAYVVPKGSSVSEGKPIPDGVIRVGTFSVERSEGTSFELRISFTVPDVPGDEYRSRSATIRARSPVSASRSAASCRSYTPPGREPCSRSSPVSRVRSTACGATFARPSGKRRTSRADSTPPTRSDRG